MNLLKFTTIFFIFWISFLFVSPFLFAQSKESDKGVAKQQGEPAINNRANLQNLENYDFVFAVIKYQGGDWYEGRVGVIELMDFVNSHKLLKAYPEPKVIDLAENEVYQYPLIYMTGHGDWELSSVELRHLKKYLQQGGFLVINDDYGINKAVQREAKKVFPNKKWVKLPSNHPIYQIYYAFPSAPKIHKHDGGPPELYALYYDGKVSVLYIKNTDIGDGWAPYQVHKDSEKTRKRALQFGLNIILYAMTR